MQHTRRTTLALLAGAVAADAGAGTVGAQADGEETGGVSVFAAELRGENQVPPVDTDAAGFAVLALDSAAGELRYLVWVAGIENVVVAHVHKGGPDANGDPVAYLHWSPDDPVSTTGVLASGTLTGDDLIGVLDGESVDALGEQIWAGRAYVNVHTEQHRPGEIRGHLRPFDALVADTGPLPS